MAQEKNMQSGEHEVILVTNADVIDALKEIVSAEAIFSQIATTGEIAERYHMEVQAVIYHADMKDFYSERLGKQRIIHIPSFEGWYKRYFNVETIDRKPLKR